MHQSNNQTKQKMKEVLKKYLYNPKEVKKSNLNVNNMDRLVKELNIKETRSIHITGTNGKGSVAWKIRSGLVSLMIYFCLLV